MTDHADTIRPESPEALAVRLQNTRVASAETCEQAAAMIARLLAERQQAIDALRQIERLSTFKEGPWNPDGIEYAAAILRACAKAASAALLNLGEQP